MEYWFLERPSGILIKSELSSVVLFVSTQLNMLMLS